MLHNKKILKKVLLQRVLALVCFLLHVKMHGCFMDVVNCKDKLE